MFRHCYIANVFSQLSFQHISRPISTTSLSNKDLRFETQCQLKAKSAVGLTAVVIFGMYSNELTGAAALCVVETAANIGVGSSDCASETFERVTRTILTYLIPPSCLLHIIVHKMAFLKLRQTFVDELQREL